ncbi:MAG: RNA polymerase sigma factor [Myxococcales bacterium]|nr:RNA polymerase sigma factor [Myxococcales bacterium]MCB9716545.1 RNA polymerase sigma factor [Myxococcales bacterium]
MPRAPSEPALPRPIDLAERRAVRTSAAPMDEGTSSEALVTRAQRGDLDAWSRLYREHFDAVFRHVCYLTGDAALAEDLVQDAFARAMTNAASYDGRSSFLNWLRGIALNVVRMHWRRSRTTDRVQGQLRTLQDLGAPEGTPERHHLQEQRMLAVYEILSTMPIHLREAFVLRELEGLPTAEAAQQLGISTGNLAVRATRARQRIRKELERRGWMPEGRRS